MSALEVSARFARAPFPSAASTFPSAATRRTRRRRSSSARSRRPRPSSLWWRPRSRRGSWRPSRRTAHVSPRSPTSSAAFPCGASPTRPVSAGCPWHGRRSSAISPRCGGTPRRRRAASPDDATLVGAPRTMKVTVTASRRRDRRRLAMTASSEGLSRQLQRECFPRAVALLQLGTGSPGPPPAVPAPRNELPAMLSF